MPYRLKRSPLDPCPVETAFAVVGGKWKARVILLLSLESLHFAQMRRALPGITQQVLSAQLKALQQSGIVSRIPGVQKGRETPTYRLTRDGQELVQALEGVASWGEKRLLAQGHRWRRPVGSLTQSGARALADSQ